MKNLSSWEVWNEREGNFMMTRVIGKENIHVDVIQDSSMLDFVYEMSKDNSNMSCCIKY